MLKTNGSVTARETYSNDVGSLVIVAGRNYTDRVPWGLVEVSQTIRFAGVHKPGVAIPKLLTTDADKKLAEQQDEIASLTN